MNHQPLDSSHIESAAHENGVLEVKYKNGAVWRYPGVPGSIHAGLMAAKSPGSYMHAVVKARYKGVQV